MLTFKKKGQDGKIEPKLDLSVETLALSNMITLEALIQTLLKKNVINQEELLEEVKKMRKMKFFDYFKSDSEYSQRRLAISSRYVNGADFFNLPSLKY